MHQNVSAITDPLPHIAHFRHKFRVLLTATASHLSLLGDSPWMYPTVPGEQILSTDVLHLAVLY